MKLKTIAMVVCSLICAGAAWTAVDFTAKNVPTVSAAEDTVDISAGATISGWADSAELKQLTISFDKNALSDFNYSAMDTETYAYIQEYLYFNGKSVKEINADTSLGALGWEYTQFPGNADDKYKVPVLIYERDAARLRLFIHKNYFAMLGDHPTFELKEGLSFVNEGQTYVMEDTRRFTYNGSSWEATKEEKDVTASVTVKGWDITGDAGELTYTRINLGEGVMPEGVGYGIIDADAWKYVQDYITINGRTVADINKNVDDSNYVYSTFPSTADDKYKIPVMIFVNNGTLEVKVHNDYIAALGEDPTIVIGVKAGLSVSGSSAICKVTKDVAVTVREQTVIVDITANVTINGWDITGDAGELTYTRINLGEGVMPEGVGYGIIDAAAWKYVQDYITINGRTVADINANVDDSAYVYSTFPSTMDAYKVPVIIYVNNGTLEVKVHNDYMASLGGNVDVIIEVKAGLSVKEGSTTYTVAKDVQTYVRRKQYTLTVEYALGTENQYLLTMGSEITLVAPEKEHYTFVGWFEKDTEAVALTVMPESDYAIYAKYTAIEYTVTFKADGEQVGETQTYTVENKTINETTAPAKEHYTVAWAAYELNGGNVVVEAVYTAIEYTVTFKADGEQVGEAQTYTVENKTISEPTAPAKEHYTVAWAAYELNGGNVVVEAVYTAIEYTVSFMDGETVVGTATYTIDNTEITEPVAPTKEGYTSAWASYELTGGDITVEVVYTLIDDGSSDDSSSGGNSSDDSSSGGSSSGGSSSDDSSSDDSSSGGSSSDDSSSDGSSSDDNVSDSASSDENSTSNAGCFGTVSGLSVSVAMLGLSMSVLLKKKENE